MAQAQYLALFAKSGKALTRTQRLCQEFLYFLDDRHQAITVHYFDRLPRWLQGSLWASQLYYILLLLWYRHALVIIDLGLQLQLGPALWTANRWRPRHWLILSAGQFKPAANQWTRSKQWSCRTCLRIADYILADSAGSFPPFVDIRPLLPKITFLTAASGPGPWPVWPRSWPNGMDSEADSFPFRLRHSRKYFDKIVSSCLRSSG